MSEPIHMTPEDAIGTIEYLCQKDDPGEEDLELAKQCLETIEQNNKELAGSMALLCLIELGEKTDG